MILLALYVARATLESMYALIDDYLLCRRPGAGPLPRISDSEIEQTRNIGRLLNPCVVRKLPRTVQVATQNYEIVQNESTWLLAQRLNWHQIPCVVMDLDEDEVELIRNAQAGDSTTNADDPVAFAVAMAKRLSTEKGLTVRALAREIGWDRSELQHQLRLADLPQDVQRLVSSGKLTVGHARRIGAARLTDQQKTEFAREVVSKKLTVRQLEKLFRDLVSTTCANVGSSETVRRSEDGQKEQGRVAADAARNLQLQLSFLEQKLSELLGCGVRLTPREVQIDYCGDFEILDGVLQRLGYNPDA